MTPTDPTTAGKTPTPTPDQVEAETRAEFLHLHKAPKDWLIVTESEVAALKAELAAKDAELMTARQEKNSYKRAATELAEEHLEETEKLHAQLATLRQQLADAKERADMAEKELESPDYFDFLAPTREFHAWLEKYGLEACNREHLAELRAKLAASEQDRAELRAEVERLKAELETHLQSLAHFTEIHATKGGMDLHIQQHPVLREMIAKTFATMVLNSPNYTEMTFSVMAEPEKRITVTVKKAEGKTPHQLRIEAEQQRDAFKADADRLAGALVPILKGDCSFCALEEAHEALAAHAKLTEGQP